MQTQKETYKMKCLNCNKELPSPSPEGRTKVYSLASDLTAILQKEGIMPSHRILGVGDIIDTVVNCCEKPKIVGF